MYGILYSPTCTIKKQFYINVGKYIKYTGRMDL